MKIVSSCNCNTVEEEEEERKFVKGEQRVAAMAATRGDKEVCGNIYMVPERW